MRRRLPAASPPRLGLAGPFTSLRQDPGKTLLKPADAGSVLRPFARESRHVYPLPTGTANWATYLPACVNGPTLGEIRRRRSSEKGNNTAASSPVTSWDRGGGVGRRVGCRCPAVAARYAALWGSSGGSRITCDTASRSTWYRRLNVRCLLSYCHIHRPSDYPVNFVQN